jgi:hypothetical protein
MACMGQHPWDLVLFFCAQPLKMARANPAVNQTLRIKRTQSRLLLLPRSLAANCHLAAFSGGRSIGRNLPVNP